MKLQETAHQAWNWFISRWELFGSLDGEIVGYWDPGDRRETFAIIVPPEIFPRHAVTAFGAVAKRSPGITQSKVTDVV